MKAIIFDTPGEPDVLKLGSYEKPKPAANELLVKVEATALNRADTLQRMGKYPPPKGASPILGLEIAGEISELGSEVDNWKVGEKVFGLIPGGGYAEFAVIHKDMAMRLPENLSMEEGAGIPEVFLTAFQAIFWLGKLEKSEKLLVHAGASGVGTAAIQLAKEIGAEVFVTASKDKHKICLELGAKNAIDYKAKDFVEEIKSFTNDKGVDLIVDFIAGPYFKKNIDSLNIDGRIVLLATLGGGIVTEFDLRKILAKRISLMGSTLRSRSLDYQIKLTKDFSNFALERFSLEKFKPVIDSVYNWNEAANAHKYMEENKNAGKIILKIT